MTDQKTQDASGASRLSVKLGVDVYIPFYARPPNKLLKYEERRFDLGNGKTGFDRIAIFLDNKGKTQEMTAQVVWDTPNAEIRG